MQMILNFDLVDLVGSALDIFSKIDKQGSW